jgi:hypothetical protein
VEAASIASILRGHYGISSALAHLYGQLLFRSQLAALQYERSIEERSYAPTAIDPSREMMSSFTLPARLGLLVPSSAAVLAQFRVSILFLKLVARPVIPILTFSARLEGAYLFFIAPGSLSGVEGIIREGTSTNSRLRIFGLVLLTGAGA